MITSYSCSFPSRGPSSYTCDDRPVYEGGSSGSSFSGPLDDSAFDNTVAYFSVRHPGTGAAVAGTAAMDVQEHGGDTVETIYYVDDGNGGAILDYAAIEAHCGTSNGSVKKWYDPIGGYHVEQSTRSQQPLICIYGKAIEAPLYDGVDDVTEIGSDLGFSTGDYPVSMHVWAIGGNQSNGSPVSMTKDTPGGKYFWIVANGADVSAQQQWDSSVTEQLASQGMDSSDFRCMLAVFDQNITFMGIDGSTNSTDTASVDWTSDSIQTFGIGAFARNDGPHNEFAGMIPEVIIFSDDKRSSQSGLHSYGRPGAKTGLRLDQSYGANCVHSYALSKQRDLYGGALLEVRESGADADQAFYPDPITGEMPTDAVENFVGANDGFVNVIYDQVGGKNAVADSDAGQAQCAASGTWQTPTFDGSDDDYYNNTSLVTSLPLSLEAIGACDTDANRPVIASLGGADNNYLALRAGMNQSGDPLEAMAWLSPTEGVAATSTGITVDQVYHFMGTYSSTSSRSGYIDGGGKGTDTTSVAPTVTRIGIGSARDASPSNWWTGTWKLSNFYSEAKSDADVSSLSNHGSPTA